MPVRNEEQHIRHVLKALFSQDWPMAKLEVIVADGGSTDRTRALVQNIQVEQKNLQCLDNPGRIVSTGLNRAIRAAQGEVVVRMDAHTEYAPDYVRQCVQVLQETGADNVGGPWIARGEGYRGAAIAAAFQSPFAVGGARGHDRSHEGAVDTVYLGCWRREVFPRFGFFDEELVRNQDDEHNLRIVRGGGKVYQSPEIRSWYQPRSSLRALFNQYTQYGYWKVRVIQKHQLPASWRHLVPGAFVLSLITLFLLSGFSFLFALLPAHHQTMAEGGRLFGSILVLALGVYIVAALAASIHTAAKSKWKLLPILPLVFSCYHFGYGYGFLHGVWDFFIRRKTGHQRFQTLTR